MKLRTVFTLAATLLLGTANFAAAADQFSLFGNASIEQGDKKNQSAVLLVSDVTADEPFAGISFESKKSLTLGELDTLSATYQILEGGIGGGSPRFQIALDTDGDGTADGNVFVYLGDAPDFTADPDGVVASGNLIASTDLRFDTSQIGGTFYDSYENAIALAGDATVVSVDLVADSGWFFEGGVQAVLITDAQVDHKKLQLKKLTAKTK